MWYFVRWTLGTVEIDTGLACKAEAVRFANAKNGTLITRDEYDDLMSEELAEVCG